MSETRWGSFFRPSNRNGCGSGARVLTRFRDIVFQPLLIQRELPSRDREGAVLTGEEFPEMVKHPGCSRRNKPIALDDTLRVPTWKRPPKIECVSGLTGGSLFLSPVWPHWLSPTGFRIQSVGTCCVRQSRDLPSFGSMLLCSSVGLCSLLFKPRLYGPDMFVGTARLVLREC